MSLKIRRHYVLMPDASIHISHVNISPSLFPLLHGLCSHEKKGGFNLISSGGGLQTDMKWMEFLKRFLKCEMMKKFPCCCNIEFALSAFVLWVFIHSFTSLF